MAPYLSHLVWRLPQHREDFLGIGHVEALEYVQCLLVNGGQVHAGGFFVEFPFELGHHRPGFDQADAGEEQETVTSQLMYPARAWLRAR